MNLAMLRCGTVLTFESRTFVPAVGDLVPCRHHGFCVVESANAGGRARLGTSGRRARPRAPQELEECLRHRPTTTVHALRRQRFTLRMLAAAQREGLVDLDLLTGKVVARNAGDQARA